MNKKDRNRSRQRRRIRQNKRSVSVTEKGEYGVGRTEDKKEIVLFPFQKSILEELNEDISYYRYR